MQKGKYKVYNLYETWLIPNSIIRVWNNKTIRTCRILHNIMIKKAPKTALRSIKLCLKRERKKTRTTIVGERFVLNPKNMYLLTVTVLLRPGPLFPVVYRDFVLFTAFHFQRVWRLRLCCSLHERPALASQPVSRTDPNRTEPNTLSAVY